MKFIVTLDPNIGKDFKAFIGDAFDTKVRIKNILRGIFVGAIIFGGIFFGLKMLSQF